jgi:hypothetical protein
MEDLREARGVSGTLTTGLEQMTGMSRERFEAGARLLVAAKDTSEQELQQMREQFGGAL